MPTAIDMRSANPHYRRWYAMMRRCCNQSDPNYKHYGARGISVYAPWREDFWAFASYLENELGPLPSPDHSLDRIDNDGNYEPGNLRWASQAQQARNKRNLSSPRNRNNGGADSILRIRRKALGYLQADVAQAIGVGQTVYSSYELYRFFPRYNVIEKLSRFLEISSDDILSDYLSQKHHDAA